MTAHFLVTGYLFVQSLIGVDPGARADRLPVPPARAARDDGVPRLLRALAHPGTGLLLADWYGAMGWGTSALADQQTGGGIAWGVGEIPTVVLAIAVAVQLGRSDDRESRRSDREADRNGDAELNAYNEMLARLGRSRA